MVGGLLGQVTTPDSIATAVCRWAIRPLPDNSHPRVLDPAVGPGTFVTAAARRLRSLGADGPLDHIVAIDVDADALARTARAVNDCPGDLTTVASSFLGVVPDAGGLADGTAPPRIGRFDAIVGNPPYVRQETIDRDHYRAHLAAFGPPGESPYQDGPHAIDGRSDAYVYFLTHATQFLDEGGRLGVVVPTKWLETRYGETLQRFLLDHYRIAAVATFEARAFADALVDAAMLCCVRRTDAARRRAGRTRFVRIREALPVDDLTEIIETPIPNSDGDQIAVDDRESHRVLGIGQEALEGTSSKTIAANLTAPPEVANLLTSANLVPLNALASVHRGVTTGANEFFLLPADRPLGIEDRFLAPAIRSFRAIEGSEVRSPPTRYLFDVHQYVATVQSRTNGPPSLATRVTNALAADEYDGALAHIARGERRGFHERRTCADRQVWFDLGPLETPPILHPKFFADRVAVIHNPDRLVPTNAVDCVSLDSDVSEPAMVAILNSTVHAAILECWGRAEGGGALQLMTYEVESVPVLDVRSLDASTRTNLRRAYDAFRGGEPGAGRELDRLVLAALGSDLSVDRLRASTRTMVSRRVDRSADVLIEEE